MIDSMAGFFSMLNGATLAQGDLLPNCPVPEYPSAFTANGGVLQIPYRTGHLIVVTQTCDLENGKAWLVALCPAFSIAELAKADPKFKKSGELNSIRKGRYEALHMLACPEDNQKAEEALVVDFREMYSLPFAFLSRYAESIGDRWRLNSPYLEHFSQAFARFFMRVGLPSSIPEFK
jgi:hypothetical protein